MSPASVALSRMLQLTLLIPVCYNLAEGSGVLDMVMVLTSSAYPSHPNDLKSKYHGDVNFLPWVPFFVSEHRIQENLLINHTVGFFFFSGDI